jgi:hypothetical protein
VTGSWAERLSSAQARQNTARQAELISGLSHDSTIQAALGGGIRVADVSLVTGLGEQRVYQIRNGGR